MINFSPLDAALKRLQDTDAKPLFWWRDDDAVSESPALDRLLALRKKFSLPLALAVIPAHVEPSLSERLRHERETSVLVHGYAHQSYAPPNSKKAEFGPHRPLDIMISEAEHGLRLLNSHFNDTTPMPVFVPPWNRIDETLAPHLKQIGYIGLSTFGKRLQSPISNPLLQINTHFDPIAWRNGGGLIAPDTLINTLAELVLQRISGGSDAPIGILTHHLVHDDAVWAFCEYLFERLLSSEAVLFKGADQLFQSPMNATVKQ